MTLHLRVLSALNKDLTSVLSTYVRQLTTTLTPVPGTLPALNTQTQSHTQTHIYILLKATLRSKFVFN